jgi:MraW methylase family
MLFTPPILIHEAIRNAAPVARARVSRMGIFSDELASSGQRAMSSLQTDVRTAPGWLSARHLLIFMAKRAESLGTEFLALIESMVRAAPGWLSARPSSIFLSAQNSALGTARRFVDPTDACAAPGWLSAQAPVDFSETVATRDYHLPVFPAEVAEWMASEPDKFIIDGTLGGGGHSEIFLKAGARVLGSPHSANAFPHGKETSRVSWKSPRFKWVNWSMAC